MRISIYTLGTRGDVQPYVALAKELIQAGHNALICTGGSFRSFVESNSISFMEISSDLMAIAQTAEGKAVLEHPVRNMGKAIALMRNVISPSYRTTLDEFFVAAKYADCIIYHPLALGAVDIALHYGIPCVSMPLIPVTYPITEFPNPIITTKNLGGRLNRISYLIGAKAERFQIDAINDFREKTLHQKRRKAGIYAFSNGQTDIPIVYPVSRYLFPEVKSWNEHVFFPGFFFLDEREEKIPVDLERFITEGPKPIAITFSSMPLSRPEQFLNNLRVALTTTGNRAILLVGNSGIRCKNDGLIYSIPAASHHWLFSKVKGVIHHGGVGTMATAIRAGIPQMIMPLSVDQPFWAKRVVGLGIGIESLREKDATSKKLAERMCQMDDRVLIHRVQDFATRVQNEPGVIATIQYLENLV